MVLRFGSVCSGIEAASVAWTPLGWEAAWLSEIEPFPSAVLKHHYTEVQNLGDMTALPGRILRMEVEAPDLLCGGTPCQAFSVAGLRRSLNDDRGNLSLTFCEIADAIDHVRGTRDEPPAIIFWENVPGVLSTKDNAFGCFLAGLAGEDDPLVAPGGKWTNAGVVLGPKRAVAWRVLDAQYFGVAQRRRRVFVVASARDDFDPAEVLFEFKGLRRDFAPSREKGEDSSGCFRNGAKEKCWPANVSSTLDTTFGTKQGLEDQHVNAGCPLFVPFISPCLETQVGGLRQPCTQAYVVTPPLTASLKTPLGNGGKDDFIVPVVANTLNTLQGIQAPDTYNYVVSASNEVTVAFNHDAQADQLPSSGRDTSISDSLTCSQHASVATQMQVRRLTPRECETLQGFPKDYTAIPWRKKPASECPDGPRYKALGNSWAVPVVAWIGNRIENALRTFA